MFGVTTAARGFLTPMGLCSVHCVVMQLEVRRVRGGAVVMVQISEGAVFSAQVAN